MKVIFLQRDSFVKLAIEYLSAALKADGHQCDLFIESGERHFLKSALESNADLFAFSCTTGGEEWVLETAAALKKECSTPIIVGGPHTTFFPQMIEQANIDYICRGEGEQALVELVRALENNHDVIKQTQNIWSKNWDSITYKTEVRPFIEDLDVSPFPDFGIYTKYKHILAYSKDMYPVMTGRGCPHSCSYCFNKTYKELYRNKGKYLRKKTPERMIAELLWAKQTYGIWKINFVDDSFFLFPKWLKQFSVLYKEQINLPFIINVEPTEVKEDLVQTVKEMGCICIRMGLESGNDHLRQSVLNKKVTTEQIKTAAGHIKRHGIKLATFNILGLPGETLDNAIETYKLNKEIGTDFIQCSLLQPYPGTAINKYVSEKGLLDDGNNELSLGESYFVSSKIKLKNEKEIINLQKLMQVFARLKMPLFLVRNIIRLPRNPMFSLIFKLSFVYSKIRTQELRIAPLVRLGLHSLSYMREKKVKTSQRQCFSMIRAVHDRQ
jgi:radical SAM superfamily enzyme YgiQ (UPF0313 family)